MGFSTPSTFDMSEPQPEQPVVGPLKLGRLLEKYMRIEDEYGRLKRHNV